MSQIDDKRDRHEQAEGVTMPIRLEGMIVGLVLAAALRAVKKANGSVAACVRPLLKPGCEGSLASMPDVLAFLRGHCSFHLDGDQVVVQVDGDSHVYGCREQQFTALDAWQEDLLAADRDLMDAVKADQDARQSAHDQALAAYKARYTKLKDEQRAAQQALDLAKGERPADYRAKDPDKGEIKKNPDLRGWKPSPEIQAHRQREADLLKAIESVRTKMDALQKPRLLKNGGGTDPRRTTAEAFRELRTHVREFMALFDSTMEGSMREISPQCLLALFDVLPASSRERLLVPAPCVRVFVERLCDVLHAEFVAHEAHGDTQSSNYEGDGMPPDDKSSTSQSHSPTVKASHTSEQQREPKQQRKSKKQDQSSGRSVMEDRVPRFTKGRSLNYQHPEYLVARMAIGLIACRYFGHSAVTGEGRTALSYDLRAVRAAEYWVLEPLFKMIDGQLATYISDLPHKEAIMRDLRRSDRQGRMVSLMEAVRRGLDDYQIEGRRRRLRTMPEVVEGCLAKRRVALESSEWWPSRPPKFGDLELVVLAVAFEAATNMPGAESVVDDRLLRPGEEGFDGFLGAFRGFVEAVKQVNGDLLIGWLINRLRAGRHEEHYLIGALEAGYAIMQMEPGIALARKIKIPDALKGVGIFSSEPEVLPAAPDSVESTPVQPVEPDMEDEPFEPCTVVERPVKRRDRGTSSAQSQGAPATVSDSVDSTVVQTKASSVRKKDRRDVTQKPESRADSAHGDSDPGFVNRPFAALLGDHVPRHQEGDGSPGVDRVEDDASTPLTGEPEALPAAPDSVESTPVQQPVEPVMDDGLPAVRSDAHFELEQQRIALERQRLELEQQRLALQQQELERERAQMALQKAVDEARSRVALGRALQDVARAEAEMRANEDPVVMEARRKLEDAEASSAGMQARCKALRAAIRRANSPQDADRRSQLEQELKEKKELLAQAQKDLSQLKLEHGRRHREATDRIILERSSGKGEEPAPNGSLRLVRA